MCRVLQRNFISYIFIHFFVNIGKFELATDSYIVRLNHKQATVAEALIYAKLH